LIIAAAGVIVYWFFNGHIINNPMLLFACVCVGAYSMSLGHKYRIMEMEYKMKYENGV